MTRWWLIAALLVVWPLTAVAQNDAAEQDHDVAAGEAVFKSQCSICHSPLAGKNMVGPTLFGIVGRKSGSVPGFHYSAANRAANIEWNADVLDRYLTSPQSVVPGTIMPYPGLKDAKQRANLIAYLETLH